MKKTLGIILSISLAFSVLALPIFAAVDTTTSATVEATTPAAPATPAKPAATAPAATPSVDTSKMAAGTYYTVVSGDFFWQIAAKHGLTIDALAKLNPQIKNVNLIFPGQKILVKAEEAAASTSTAAVAPVAKKLYQGIGMAANYRDNTARQKDHDNLNVTTVAALFDDAGKIVKLQFDVVEILPDMFPGWMDPEAADKSLYKDAQAKGFNWETKKEEGDAYGMKASAVSGKEWWEQMNFYEEYFKGKTVAEVQDWFVKYCDANGRPYKMAYPDKLTDADKAKVATFTEAEKKMLVDVTTGATMSLQDPHSRFIDALVKAYEVRKEVK
ncbi:chlorophenol reductase [Desulfitobacterium chlororespirans]|uniref:LysM repeat-containing protein n=1 Tax=Desulfitobacterium chlororespirans DSM 11544 TaxID=1121395 RepID=A0A1M7TXE7_9FIRM|nr:chlorophenol reductase [Desulfitobacterium chlororespirans]SHN75367.1 LysM repeat-containing protein [Desulfitobacterium chlororespirans DSM 11544]